MEEAFYTQTQQKRKRGRPRKDDQTCLLFYDQQGQSTQTTQPTPTKQPTKEAQLKSKTNKKKKKYKQQEVQEELPIEQPEEKQKPKQHKDKPKKKHKKQQEEQIANEKDSTSPKQRKDKPKKKNKKQQSSQQEQDEETLQQTPKKQKDKPKKKKKQPNNQKEAEEKGVKEKGTEEKEAQEKGTNEKDKDKEKDKEQEKEDTQQSNQRFTDPYCSECADGGENLVMCEKCPLVFHISCLKAFGTNHMPLDKDPWHCPVCSFRETYGVKQLYVYLTQRFEEELMNVKSALFWVLLLFQSSEAPEKIKTITVPEPFQVPTTFSVTLKYYGLRISEQSYKNEREDEFYVSPEFNLALFVEVLSAALKEKLLPAFKAQKIKGPALSHRYRKEVKNAEG